MDTNRFVSTVRCRATRGALILLLLALGAPMPAPVASVALAPPLMQFTAGGHVVGFAPTQVILASLDHALRVEFVGTAGVTPVASGADAPSSSDGLAMRQAQPFGSVTYPELWRGISVEYRAAEGNILKSTYHVAPGADAAQIRLRYNVPVAAQGDGSLQLPFGRGYISESAPIAWQEIDGARVGVEVAFATRPSPGGRGDGGEVSFLLGAYDARYSLTIDPNYIWHTFYGSDIGHAGNGIAVDGSGNVYIAGYSNATWQGEGVNPDPLHAYSGGTGGNSDIVVVKLTSAGAYQWHTFYGSAAGSNSGSGIAVDGSGNVYIAGYSNATWLGDGGTDPLHDYSGGSDIVALKLTSDGVYEWHTFYGSSGDDNGYGIAVDGSGNVYIAGSSNATWSSGPGGVGGTNPLHAYSGGYDIVALKLTSAGAYQWHTFYGSTTGADYGGGIAVDGSGNVYITGSSNATWSSGPGGVGGTDPLHTYSGGNDIVALKLTSAGAYQWHTFYGSTTGDDSGERIAVDGSGNVYIAGSSNATWQGEGANPNPLHAYSGDNDIVALKLTSAGAYQWHTFYGSTTGADYGKGIAVDGSGNVYITGNSNATWQGDGSTNPLHAYTGGDDIVALKLTSAGAFRWHTFYGSSDSYSEVGNGIAVDGSGNVYITGDSHDTWQGDGGTDPLHAHSTGCWNIVALKLSGTPTAVTLSSFSAKSPAFDLAAWLADILRRWGR